MTGPQSTERALAASLRWLDAPTARRVLDALDLDEDVEDLEVRAALEAARRVVARGEAPGPLLLRAELLARGRVPGQRDPGDLLVDLWNTSEYIDYTQAPALVPVVQQEALRRRCWQAGSRIRQAAENGPQDALLITTRRETEAVAAMRARHLASRAALGGARGRTERGAA